MVNVKYSKEDLIQLQKLIDAKISVSFNDIPKSLLESFREEMVGQTCATGSTPAKVLFFYHDFLNWYNYIIHGIDYEFD